MIKANPLVILTDLDLKQSEINTASELFFVCPTNPGYLIAQNISEKKIQRIASPWASEQKLNKGWLEVQYLYDKVFPKLSNSLNDFHGVKYDMHDWEIVLGSWLWQFLTIILDRWSRIDAVEKSLSLFNVTGINTDNLKPPIDSGDTFYLASSDLYNLAIYSKIMEYKNIQYNCADIDCRVERQEQNSGKIKEIAKLLFHKLSLLQNKSNNYSLLHDTYIPLDVLFKIKFKLRTKIFVSFRQNKQFYQSLNEDAGQRADLEAIFLNGNSESKNKSLLNFIETNITSFVPICFVEGFNIIRLAASSKLDPGCDIVLSAGAWHNDEFFKHIVIKARHNGAKIVGIQHGGTYLTLNRIPHFKFEERILDQIYIWGEETVGKTSFVPAYYIKEKSNKIKNSYAKSKILYFISLRPRFQTALNNGSDPMSIERSFDIHCTFFRELGENLLKDVHIRQPNLDFGWNLKERLSEFENSGLKINHGSKSFKQDVSEATVSVLDSFSTVWLELLYYNKPFILIKNATLDLNSKAMNWVDQLEDLGVVYPTPKEAATFLKTIYPSVDNWWNQPKLQKLRENICDKYIREPKSIIDFWETELDSANFKTHDKLTKGYQNNYD